MYHTLTKEEIYTALDERHSPETQKLLSAGNVAIAGLGGLGSNVAYALARIGVGHLHLIDFDVVDITNLNRQQYFMEHIGMYKTDALKSLLLKINPYLDIRTDCVKVTDDNLQELFADATIVCEAFDNPEAKAMLVNGILEHFPEKKLVSATGMALLEKLHFLHHKEARIEKLNASMDQYRDTAVFLKEHKQVIVNVFAITMFQRFALFTATWFVYKAFGLGGAKAVAVITLQAVIAVSVDMLPLPGGMGISEKLFAMIFIPVFGKRLLLPGMILSRGIGYYTELGLSALLTIVANFTIGRKREIEC